MPAPFAAIEARVNRAVFRHLSNAECTLAGVVVQGIFETPYERGDVGGMGMASTRPTFTLPTTSVPPRVADWFAYFVEPLDPMDLQMTINHVIYQVVAHEPDGAGVSVLVLEKVGATAA